MDKGERTAHGIRPLGQGPSKGVFMSTTSTKNKSVKEATRIGIKCRQDIYENFEKAREVSGHSITVAIERALQWYNAQYLDDKSSKKK